MFNRAGRGGIRTLEHLILGEAAWTTRIRRQKLVGCVEHPTRRLVRSVSTAGKGNLPELNWEEYPKRYCW